MGKFPVLTAADLCKAPTIAEILRTDRYVRAIIIDMLPFLMQKMAVGAAAGPASIIVRQLLRKTTNCRALGVSMAEPLSQLVTWGELAIVWMPLVPGLGPLIVIAVTFQLVALIISIRYLGLEFDDSHDPEDECGRSAALSRNFLGLSVVISWSMLGMFFHQAHILLVHWYILGSCFCISLALFASPCAH